jgi:hypothetical protein
MKTLRVALAVLPVALFAMQAQAQFCNNDNDCACGQVCSYNAPSGQACVTAGTDNGWCTLGAVDNGCLYADQSCCGIYCYPAWTSSSVCLKQPDGGLEVSTGGPSCPTGGSSGGSTTTTTVSGSTSGGSSSSTGTTTTAGSSSSSSGSKSSTSEASSSSGSSAAGSSSGGASSTSNSSGGCGSAPGGLSFAALLAVGLLARSRRRE